MFQMIPVTESNRMTDGDFDCGGGVGQIEREIVLKKAK